MPKFQGRPFDLKIIRYTACLLTKFCRNDLKQLHGRKPAKRLYFAGVYIGDY